MGGSGGIFLHLIVYLQSRWYLLEEPAPLLPLSFVKTHDQSPRQKSPIARGPAFQEVLKPEDGRQTSPQNVIWSQFLMASCLIMVALHVWGASQPSHENWGVHLFAFYPPWISWVALLLSFSLLIPAMRGSVTKKIASIALWSSRLPSPIIFLAIGGVTIALASLLPAKINVLGDSDLILSLTPQNPGMQDVSANFRNQPLTYYALRGVQYILGGGASVDVGYTYQILDDVAALLFVSLIILFLHFINVSPLEKLLIGGYIFFQTGLQFFFGYVENYALLSAFVMAFMITGWLALERKIHPIYAIMSFALMIGLHLGTIIFLPAPLILLYQVWRERRIEAVVLMAGGIIGSALFFHLSNYSLEQLISRIEVGIRIDMLPLVKSYPGGPYAMFSFLHLVDWANASLFLLSFGCFLIPVLACLPAREIRWSSPLALFLLTAASCGIAFTFIFNAALGMARDWDLLVSFLIPVHFLVIFLLLPYFRVGRESHRVITIMLILGILRVGAWIGINADPDRHLQRAEVLTTPGLSGTFPVIYYEALGKAFWHKNDFDRSRIWYERYLTIDSLNPRVLGNLAAVYDKLGMRDRYFETLKQGARSGTGDATIYLNLGNEYVRRKDTLSGIGMIRRVLEIDPAFRQAHANLGIIYMTQGNYPLAAKYASEAIALGMHEPVVYFCAGYAFFKINDDENALHYLDSYMSMSPGDKRVRPLLETIKIRMHGTATGMR